MKNQGRKVLVWVIAAVFALMLSALPAAAGRTAPGLNPARTSAAAKKAKKREKKAKKASKEANAATKTSRKHRTSKREKATATGPGATGAATGSMANAPGRTTSTSAASRNAPHAGMVWVNTKSGIYHKGGRYYGKTKQGKWMTEADAIKAGYRAAKHY